MIEEWELIARTPAKSRRGRRIDERLHHAWIEWEMETREKPTYQYLAQKHYGDGRRYRETVKKGITRLHRLYEKRESDEERIRKEIHMKYAKATRRH